MLEWARSHSISRIIIDGVIQTLPGSLGDDAQFAKTIFSKDLSAVTCLLVREIINSEPSQVILEQSLLELITLSQVLASSKKGEVAPKLLVGQIENGAKRTLKVQKQLGLSHPYICSSCSLGFSSLPESTIDGLTLGKIQQIKLANLKEFFKSGLEKDWQRLFELDVDDLCLAQPLDEVPLELLNELRLLSLVLSEIRDSLIFVDSTLTAKGNVYAVELSMLGNCVAAQSQGGISLNSFLPADFQRLSEKLDRQNPKTKLAFRRNSIEPLLVECKIEKAIIELYASLPEARLRNLNSQNLSFHAAKCLDCGGLGYSIFAVASLGKRAKVCNTCFGYRYQENILFVKYQDISLADLLELNILEAKALFVKRPEIASQLGHLIDLGLENYRLGDEFRTLPSKAKYILY